MSVTNVISALSLNLDLGLPLVQDLQCLKMVFALFTRPESSVSRKIVTADFSQSLGGSLEELFRHVPALRAPAMA